MPIIINPDDMNVTRSGDGWVELTIADSEQIGAPAMIARRWTFEPNARGPLLTQGDTEQLLYVIRGSGTAVVDGEELSLEHESVLWVEPGEKYQFIAGPQGLEILQGYAPGE